MIRREFYHLPYEYGELFLAVFYNHTRQDCIKLQFTEDTVSMIRSQGAPAPHRLLQFHKSNEERFKLAFLRATNYETAIQTELKF